MLDLYRIPEALNRPKRTWKCGPYPQFPFHKDAMWVPYETWDEYLDFHDSQATVYIMNIARFRHGGRFSFVSLFAVGLKVVGFRV